MIGRSLIVAATLIATATAAVAQSPGEMPRIGYLETDITEQSVEALRSGLSDLGYVENRTIAIERLSAAGRIERLPALAAELVSHQPKVIVAASPMAALAAKAATTTIPIVMTNVSDPVELGLVASLARPGGNVTGMSSMATGLSGKRLDLLRDLLPGVSRVGIVWEGGGMIAPRIAYQELEAAAPSLNLALESFEMAGTEDIDAAFKAAGERTRAAVVLNSALVVRHREAVVAAALRHKVAAIFYDADYTAAGGLISYGARYSELHRRAATYVDKILKGAKPADLPVERPTKFELVVNLKTAKAIGIAIPQSILLRADEVIE
jgi:putative ABC transport system substrate-binding protein